MNLKLSGESGKSGKSERVLLTHGAHPGSGQCAREEAHRRATGVKKDANPPGVTECLSLLPPLNDWDGWCSDEERTDFLLPWLPLLLACDRTEDQARALLLADYAVRIVAGVECAPIVDTKTARAADAAAGAAARAAYAAYAADAADAAADAADAAAYAAGAADAAYAADAADAAAYAAGAADAADAAAYAAYAAYAAAGAARAAYAAAYAAYAADAAARTTYQQHALNLLRIIVGC